MVWYNQYQKYSLMELNKNWPLGSKKIPLFLLTFLRKYEGGTTTLENVDSEKDIGVTIDQHLNFEKHIQTQISKANQIVGLTRRSFVHLDNRTFSLHVLFKALVRPQMSNHYISNI